MKDKFKHLETEMTLEEKFALVCKAIGAKSDDVKGSSLETRHAHNRAFIANFLSEYLRFGLAELMHRSPVTLYAMTQRVNLKRIKNDPNVLRLDKLLAKHIDAWLKN